MDKFETHASGLESPASDAFAIVPNDGADLAQVTRAIYVGSVGHVVVRMKSGANVSFKNVNSGTVLAVRVRGINATGTTASDLVGLA